MACVLNVTVSLPSYNFVCARQNMLYNAVIFLTTLGKGIAKPPHLYQAKMYSYLWKTCFLTIPDEFSELQSPVWKSSYTSHADNLVFLVLQNRR